VREWGIVMSEGALMGNRYIKGCVNGKSLHEKVREWGIVTRKGA
jgi:hypothetical protein